MFKVEQAIAVWRQQLREAGINSCERLEELEGHLREEVEAQVRSGVPEEVAFEAALKGIGRPDDLRSEYAKVRESIYDWMKRLCFGLAGIQNYRLVTNMNHSIKNLESRWPTYAKNAALIAPAIFVWASFSVLVLPKLNQVRLASGMEMWKPVSVALAATEFVRMNFAVLSVVALGALVLLEWRSGWWARRRRLIFGMAAYGLNILVLGLMATMTVFAVAAGAHLLPGK